MASSNNLVISNTGLTEISRELIGKKRYNPNLVTVIGNPLITNTGIASAFSATSYIMRDDLSFNQDTSELRIKVACIYKEESLNFQTLLNLVNPLNTEENILLQVNSNSISFFTGTFNPFTISNLIIHDGDSLNIDLRVSNNRYNLILIQNKVRVVFTGTFDYSFNFSNYSCIYIGNNSEVLSEFWYGFIDLTELSIYGDENVIYSPTYATFFRFTKILVSDSSETLTDSSIAKHGHIYEFPVTEINKTSNNILLTATIEANVYLNINQIGLYATSGGKRFLFGLVSNLVLQKEKDLGYDLIFTIKTNIGVVNTLVYPKIIVKEGKYATLNVLDTLKNVHANTVVDMERAINRNATLLGYEPDEVFFRLFNTVRFANKNYEGTHLYARVKQNIHSNYRKEYTGEGIELIGSPVVEDSVASDFSTSDYVVFSKLYGLQDQWEYEISFTIGDTFPSGTILCLCNSNEEPTFTLFMDNSGNLCTSAPGVFSTHQLFETTPRTKFYVKITFDGSTYSFYKKTKQEDSYVRSNFINATESIGFIAGTYLGVLQNNGVISSPFSGSLTLSDFSVTSDGENYSPCIAVGRTIELQDFYYFIPYPASFYKIKNLSGLINSNISYLEGSLTGKNDSIDFSNEPGCSLVIGIKLTDGADRTILIKDDKVNSSTYFSLTFENYALIFRLYLENDVIELKKEYNELSFRELTDNPSTVTITCDNQVGTPIYKMYLNSEKVDEKEGASKDYLNHVSYKLSNYFLSMSEADENNVTSLLSFKGILTEDDVHYLCTLLGTNF